MTLIIRVLDLDMVLSIVTVASVAAVIDVVAIITVGISPIIMDVVTMDIVNKTFSSYK
jgi:hypothetical protein